MSGAARAEVLTRLAAADPARGLPVDTAARAALWQRIRAGEGSAAPLLADPRRGSLRPRTRGVLVLVALLLVALGALAAGGVIEIGSPAKLPFSTLGNAHEGTGRTAPRDRSPPADRGPRPRRRTALGTA